MEQYTACFFGYPEKNKKAAHLLWDCEGDAALLSEGVVPRHRCPGMRLLVAMNNDHHRKRQCPHLQYKTITVEVYLLQGIEMVKTNSSRKKSRFKYNFSNKDEQSNCNPLSLTRLSVLQFSPGLWSHTEQT